MLFKKNILTFVVLITVLCFNNNLFGRAERILSPHSAGYKHLSVRPLFFVMEKYDLFNLPPIEEPEIWKDIKGLEGIYQISNKARVKSLYRKVQYSNGKVFIYNEKILKKGIIKGYEAISLMVNKKNHSFRIHRLLAIAFIPNPENKPCINHKNGVKNDNRLENLEWCTIQENTQHSYDNGLQVHPEGVDWCTSKLNAKQINEIKNKYSNNRRLTYDQIGIIYNVSGNTISRVLNKVTYKNQV